MTKTYPDLVRGNPDRFQRSFRDLLSSKGRNHNQDLLRSYYIALADSPIGATERAVKQLMRDRSTFLPPAGELRELADTIGLEDYYETLPPTPKPDSTPDEARLQAMDRFFNMWEALAEKGPMTKLRAKHQSMAPPRVACPDCRDAGWTFATNPLTAKTLGYAAEFASRCHCSQSNPELERRRLNRKLHR